MGKFKSEQVSVPNFLDSLDGMDLTGTRYWEAKLAAGHMPSEAYVAVVGLQVYGLADVQGIERSKTSFVPSTNQKDGLWRGQCQIRLCWMRTGMTMW